MADSLGQWGSAGMAASAWVGLWALLAATVASVTPSLTPRPKYSKYWGKNGELWDPSGRLMDWSFAGEAGMR